MPIYEYKCKKCGHVFEAQQSFGDEPLKTCCQEGCNGRVQKLFSPPAIIFKGSGWYCTDNGRTGSTARRESDNEKSKPEKTKETAKEAAGG